MVLSKEDLGKLIKKARELKSKLIAERYTQAMLANDVGVSRSYLGDIESGRTYPSYRLLQKIASACGVPLSFFDEQKENDVMEPYKAGDVIPISLLKKISLFEKIPVAGYIRTGEPMLAEQNVIGFVELPSDLLNGGEFFGLKVVGDSMNLSRICEGDIAIVKKQPYVENGEIAVVLIDDENATIKRFYRTDSTITLVPHSSNPEHAPRILDQSKITVQVLGKVVRAIIAF